MSSKTPNSFFILTSENHGTPSYQWQNMSYAEIVTLLEAVKLDILLKLRNAGGSTRYVTDLDKRLNDKWGSS